MKSTDLQQNKDMKDPMVFNMEDGKGARVILGLNTGWKFAAEEQPVPEYDAYQLTKTGGQVSPAAMSYDDHTWETVDLPHDFIVLQELNPKAKDYNGYLEQKNCWYRRFFKLGLEDRDKRLVLHFEGVSGESRIWVNGCLMKVHSSSYCGISLDITDVVRYGDEVNLISVYMDHSIMQGWWYQGGGLYRNVWLEKMDFTYIDETELQIITEHKKKYGNGDFWTVKVHGRVNHRYGDLKKCSLKASLLEPNRRKIDTSTCFLAADGSMDNSGEVYMLEFCVSGPHLWDLYKGNLYHVCLELEQNEHICDRYEETFGFRKFQFDAEKGFSLNGKQEKIKGFCFHEDEGNLGWAIDKSVYERRLRQMIEMGANAYRCSHNAPAKELLELCDAYGILVMEEVRRFDSGEIGCLELCWQVKRDRNHPSVIMWSIGNEETWQGEERGYRIAKSMKRMIQSLDPMRPVTMAMHSGFEKGGAVDAVDIVGVNYNYEELCQIHERYPDKPMIGTENYCLADEVVECGNLISGSEEAYKALEFAETHDFYSGTFAWAGADYRGEHRNLGFFTDACPLNCNGDKKDGFYRYMAKWSDKPVLHLCGHWNRTNEQERKVVIYTNLESVSLYLNGKLSGCLRPDEQNQAICIIPWEAGEIQAVGKTGDCEVIDYLRTSKEAYAYRIWPEKEQYEADGRTYVTVWVEAVDSENTRVRTASHIFEISCNDKAEIVCTDNADPYCSCFPEKTTMCLYKGKGKAVLKTGMSEGILKVRVSGMLKSAECEVKLVPCENSLRPGYKELAPVINPYINDWFISHIYEEEPDIYEYTTDDNYIYWKKSLERASMLGYEMPFFYNRGGGYVVYCMEPNMPMVEEGKTGAVVFEEITGEAKILISMRDYSNRIRKQFFYEKKGKESGAIRVPLSGIVSEDRLIIKLVIKGNHAKCGITGPVRFEV